MSPMTILMSLEFLQLCVERFFLFIGSSFVRAVHIEDSVVVEPAFYSQQTQSVADRLPLNHTTLHPAQHYKAGTQLIGCAAALIVLRPKIFRTFSPFR